MTTLGQLRNSYVVHFFSRMDLGGAELRTIDVVSRTGASFDFVAISGRRGSLDDGLRRAGHGVFNHHFTLIKAITLCKLMRARHHRVAHSHLGLASGPILFLAWLAGVPTRIAHFRSDAVGGTRSIRKTFYLGISRWMIRVFATHIVGVSPGSLDFGWRADWRDDSRCQVIPNGFDAKQLRASANTSGVTKKDQLVVVNVGRADPVKNRGRALAIWAKVAVKQESTLYIVGALNARDSLAAKAVADSMRDGSKLVSVGDTRAVAKYIGEADVLLSTSTREGLPGVILEALAVGTPVVASILPGTEWIASTMPGIELCSLEESDLAWVQKIETASQLSRQDIMAAFDKSPFTITSAVHAFCDLWGLQQ